MFHDACECDKERALEADICIVGAGIAGLTIAREFLDRGERVVLLEGGDAHVSRWSQSLYRGTNTGAPNHDPTFSRFRVFGGSGTRWTGQCVPLDAIDFEQRESMAHSGWPFDLAHLQPYYARAGDVFGFEPPGFDVPAWQTCCGQIDPIAGEGLEAGMIRFAYPDDLGEILRPKLASSENIGVWLNANIIGFETDEAATRVTAARIKTPDGRALSCRAKRFVLACGGIENARLLLASHDRMPSGLGNQHDLVGRYFMDHPYLTTGEWQPSNKAKAQGLHLIDNFKRVARERGAHVVFTVSDTIRRNEQLNACVGYFIHREAWQLDPAYYSRGGQALTRIAECLRGERLLDASMVKSPLDLLRDPGSAARTLVGNLRQRRGSPPRLALRMCVEATPRPDSRVTLLRETDALGLQRPQINWRINDADWLGVTRFRELLAQRIEAQGLGHLIDDAQLNDAGWPLSMAGGKHHMGTTRMHDDPTQGVVDSASRLHGIDNFYVTGSSVFPTGGWANPTFTILALAIRLADHLKQVG